MVKLVEHECCRIEGLEVESLEEKENIRLYKIATEELRTRYDLYRKEKQPDAPDSSNLLWYMGFLRKTGLETDRVTFNIHDTTAEIAVHSFNDKASKYQTLEVRAVSKDEQKSLWFVGLGTAESLGGRRGVKFYEVFASLDGEAGENSKNAFAISCDELPNDVVKVDLRYDFVDALSKLDGESHSDLHNELQVLATAMTFQPLFLRLLLKGNEDQHERIEKWLKSKRPTHVHTYRTLVKEVESSENEISKDTLEEVIDKSQILAGFALEDFPVPSTTGNRRTYTDWLRSNLKKRKEG